MDFENKKVSANGNDFSYWLEGSGDETIVFIHGEIHGKNYWKPQFEYFASSFTCLAYDRRGHAGSDTAKFGFSVENQTKDLKDILDTLALERVHLVALAFGTTIAANFAIQNPGRVKSLTISAWGELYEARDYLARWEYSGKKAADALDQGGRDALIELLRKEGGKTMFKVIPDESSPNREFAIQLLSSHSAHQFRYGMLEVASSVPNLIPGLEKLDLPVLGMCGSADPFPNDVTQLAGLKNYREADPIPNAGRFANIDNARDFNTTIINFLNAL